MISLLITIVTTPISFCIDKVFECIESPLSEEAGKVVLLHFITNSDDSIM
jgi:hypothetical protein